MSLVGALFGKKALEVGAGALGKVAEVIDDSTLSKEERANLAAQIMVEELKQGNNYTKMLRPTVGYIGLVVIIWNYSIVPLWAKSPLILPDFFWIAWGGIMSVYSIGRSAEKINGGK